MRFLYELIFTTVNISIKCDFSIKCNIPTVCRKYLYIAVC